MTFAKIFQSIQYHLIQLVVSLILGYILKENAEIAIKIYTSHGGLVLERNIKAGDLGVIGSPDGLYNLIQWDGYGNEGRLAANGGLSIAS